MGWLILSERGSLWRGRRPRSLPLAVALGIAIALRRSGDLGRRKAWILTFGVLAVAIGVTSAVAVLLPGSGG